MRVMRALALAGVALAGLIAAALTQVGVRRDAAFLCFGVAAVPWLLALRAVRHAGSPATRAQVAWIGLVALVLRAPCLVHVPIGSDDHHRYLWDGRVQRAGIDPYRHAPAAPEL